MNISAPNIYDLYIPEECAKRLFLRSLQTPEKPLDPYQEVLFDLGKRHELDHLKSIGPHVDLSAMTMEEKITQTKKFMASKTSIIYQPAFQAEITISGIKHSIFGNPDFLILSGSSYIIRDAKMARKVDEVEHHTEVVKQLQFYGYLFQKATGTLPAGLQVVSGTGAVLEFGYDGGGSAEAEVGKILHIKTLGAEPYMPVGWTRCNGCGFGDGCWKAAMDGMNVAVLSDVDKGTAFALRDVGINTVDELLDNYDVSSLKALKKARGEQMVKVGVRAYRIFDQARALKSGEHMWVQPIKIPFFNNYVMFDLEGMPPYLDEIDTVYLWGLKVYGAKPSTYTPAVAPMGSEGDKQGWLEFLRLSKAILDEYGDIPFVHYSSYEKTKLDLYLSRYGDDIAIAERVKSNLFDLYPEARTSVILAAPSYSLKVLEKLAGFKRSQEEYGGSWSMAQYIKAMETKDSLKREELMKTILVYNEEDLQATWEVMGWLKRQGQ